MNWQNMKKMQCPKCRELLVEKSNRYQCSDDIDCRFIINKTKFNSIVSMMYTKAGLRKDPVQEEQDNFNRLQHLEDEDNCHDRSMDD